MPDALFDSYLIVDWSARSVPGPARPSPDSLWWTLARRDGRRITAEPPAYARTRAEATDRLAALLDAECRAGRRVLAGFDFPFGYPAGVAARLAGRPDALALWRWLAGQIRDDAANRNNRYAVAERINRAWDGLGPMWGRPAHLDHPALPPTARARHGDGHPPERRLADARARGAKTVWQLAYAGSVGSQILLGLPALERLRADPRLAGHIAVWPFETGLAAPEAPIVLAEVYPSLIRAAVAGARRESEVPDAAQTRVNALAFARLDAEGGLAPLFAGPPDLTPRERRLIETEEAWILGLGMAERLAAAARACADTPQAPKLTAPAPLRYERDPAAIYRQSWEIVRAETRLDHLPADLHAVAVRLVHACGMPDVANRLAWSDDLAAAARAALAGGAPVLCDCEAVASGVVRSRLPAGNPVICTLNDPATPDRAGSIGNTRSAAAVELWRDHLADALAVIGNAPTALFHLLELLDAGWPRPAAILAFPVGFVGAAESKAELAANPRGVPFLTLRGRRGGSAMAAAAVNALAAGLEAPR
ncbi:MAG TPA: precorrin-8X methylmutase [Thermohalobaculum sp.]|nr:precorrin-8X methylmutase [Thermohalobaculum sp.]